MHGAAPAIERVDASYRPRRFQRQTKRVCRPSRKTMFYTLKPLPVLGGSNSGRFCCPPSATFCLTRFLPHNHGVAAGFHLARSRASCVCFFEGEIWMFNNDDQSAISPTRDGSVPRGNSGISTAQATGTQPDLNLDPLTEWAQRAMARAKELHGNDALRREVAKRSF
jgi:hypothetical protein